MKITLNVEGEAMKEELILTNEELNNDNYIEIIIGDNSYTVNIEELYNSIEIFYKQKYARHNNVSKQKV